jgi:hypothetical protein
MRWWQYSLERMRERLRAGPIFTFSCLCYISVVPDASVLVYDTPEMVALAPEYSSVLACSKRGMLGFRSNAIDTFFSVPIYLHQVADFTGHLSTGWFKQRIQHLCYGIDELPLGEDAAASKERERRRSVREVIVRDLSDTYSTLSDDDPVPYLYQSLLYAMIRSSPGVVHCSALNERYAKAYFTTLIPHAYLRGGGELDRELERVDTSHEGNEFNDTTGTMLLPSLSRHTLESLDERSLSIWREHRKRVVSRFIRWVELLSPWDGRRCVSVQQAPYNERDTELLHIFCDMTGRPFGLHHETGLGFRYILRTPGVIVRGNLPRGKVGMDLESMRALLPEGEHSEWLLREMERVMDENEAQERALHECGHD